jgi:catechol 2,3-dioxygenase-like lactoylglutathione lyase family enzyme
MDIRHVGLRASSEENADQFFKDLLGLKKQVPKTLPAALAQALFHVDADLKVINYGNEHAHFEIFIYSPDQAPARPIEHVCLEVDDLPEFLQRCRGLNVNILRVPKGEGWLTFISDSDNNLFEIREKKKDVGS